MDSFRPEEGFGQTTSVAIRRVDGNGTVASGQLTVEPCLGSLCYRATMDLQGCTTHAAYSCDLRLAWKASAAVTAGSNGNKAIQLPRYFPNSNSGTQPRTIAPIRIATPIRFQRSLRAESRLPRREVSQAPPTERKDP